MLVIDVGWPSQPDYDHSRKKLREIIDSVRSTWWLGGSPARAEDPDFRPPQHHHASDIAESLAPLRSLDSATFVDVIFLPFARVQDADDILRELFETAYQQDIKQRALDLAAREERLPPAFANCGLRLFQPQTFPRCAARLQLQQSDLDAARERAATELSRLPDTIEVDDDDQVKVETSSVVLDAAWRVLEAYAAPRDTAAFISISWVVSAFRGSLVNSQRPFSPVMLVAATGNEPGRIVNGDINTIEFGARASESHVIAVMNMNANGDTTCRSSIVDPQPLRLKSTNAVGFDGSLSNGECGTSFSAPRVAWVLALGDALRPGRRTANWALDITGKLRCIRESRDLRGTLLRPMRYLGSAKPGCD